jgi:hypothetical protein
LWRKAIFVALMVLIATLAVERYQAWLAETAAPVSIEQQDGPRARLLAPRSEPPQAEPPGNAGAPSASRSGPDSLKRFERKGF